MVPDSPQFDALAETLVGAGRAVRSTMMGFPCLRTPTGAFFAALGAAEELIVKLPEERIAALVDRGEARTFAPAGRRFREWAIVVGSDPERWAALAEEARRFVTMAP